jgi:hypothetical protein
MADEMFPILGHYGKYPEGCPSSIPWAVIAPHEEQARRNHGQTLQRLAERGGLSPAEAVAVLTDQPWRSMPDGPEVAAELNRLIAAAATAEPCSR